VRREHRRCGVLRAGAESAEQAAGGLKVLV